MYTKKENKSPGKFEGNPSELQARVLYSIVQNGGCNEEMGNSTLSAAWLGLIKGKHYTFIVREDCYGFFEVDYASRNHEEVMKAWQEISTWNFDIPDSRSILV